MSKKLKNLLILHGTVIIFGYTGIWGKLISIEAIPLVWWRILIAIASIFLFLVLSKKLGIPDRKMLVKFCLVGGAIAVHWITFFAAIKVSNVSVALAVMASAAFFTSVLDPLISGKKFIRYEAILGLITIFGITIIFGFEFRYFMGILLALCSAFLAALFTVINGQFIQKNDSYTITFWEMIGGFVAVSIFLFAQDGYTADLFKLSLSDLKYLLLLGVLATTIGFIASVKVMEVLSPFTVALTVNLEPVYAIILALIYFGDSESMSWQFYVGTIIILGTIFLNTYLKRKKEAKTGIKSQV
ncbi:MAG: DMT family transporter [Flavobacteriales bacterium]|nr:DMT family transporter [Flavobacteriales bacterium]